MSWTDQGDEVKVNFEADQSRVFLQIRRRCPSGRPGPLETVRPPRTEAAPKG